MENRTILLNLSRILSGYYIFSYGRTRWKLKYPNTQIKYEADLIAEQEYQDLKYVEWPTLQSVVGLMINQGLWNPQGDQRIEQVEKSIENLKVDLYKNFLQPQQAAKIRKDIKRKQKEYSNLYNQRHAYDYLTIEAHCSEVKNNYILTHSLYDEEDSRPFLTDENIRYLRKISDYLTGHTLNITEFRKIARSSEWSQYWGTKEGHLFDKSIIEWTDEQRTLVSLSRMYSAAREHPDSPDEKIFEDDDAFDGWAILERRKIDKDKSKRRTDKMLPGKIADAQEVYVMASNREEAEDIFNLNDVQGSAIIQERKRVLRSVEQIEEQNLPDVRRDIIIESNQMRTRK